MKVQPTEFLKRSSVVQKIIKDGAQMVVDMNTGMLTAHQPRTFSDYEIEGTRFRATIRAYFKNKAYDLPHEIEAARSMLEVFADAGLVDGSFYVMGGHNTREKFTDRYSMRKALTNIYFKNQKEILE